MPRTTIPRIAERDTVIGNAAPMSTTCSHRRQSPPGGAKRARWMASGRVIASTAANSRGCAAVDAGLMRPSRVAKPYPTTLANPGIAMYFVMSKWAKNWTRPITAITVTPRTIRRIRVFSLSDRSMPSAASSSTPAQPKIEMRPRSAPFCSKVGSACRLADMYDAMTTQVKRTATTRIGWVPRSSPKAGRSQNTRYKPMTSPANMVEGPPEPPSGENIML